MSENPPTDPSVDRLLGDTGPDYDLSKAVAKLEKRSKFLDEYITKASLALGRKGFDAPETVLEIITSNTQALESLRAKQLVASTPVGQEPLTSEELQTLTILFNSELKSWRKRVFHDAVSEVSMKKFADIYIASLESIGKKLGLALEESEKHGR